MVDYCMVDTDAEAFSASIFFENFDPSMESSLAIDQKTLPVSYEDQNVTQFEKMTLNHQEADTTIDNLIRDLPNTCDFGNDLDLTDLINDTFAIGIYFWFIFFI